MSIENLPPLQLDSLSAKVETMTIMMTETVCPNNHCETERQRDRFGEMLLGLFPEEIEVGHEV